MIAKEKTVIRKSNRNERAGEAAEKQMAFYLRRQFGDDPSVHVFNDLRLDRDGEIAQIDHLLLHKHGFIIIESKSVTGEFRINDQSEFARVSRKRSNGMPSPIQQAKRQGDLLKRLLIDHREILRRKKVLGLLQGGFRHCPIQVLVAISDQGIIQRPRKTEIVELHKADQIPDEARKIIERHRKAGKLTAKIDGDWGMYSFHPEEIGQVTEFLLSQHAPLPTSSQPPRSRSEPTTKPPIDTRPTFLCMHCHATNLVIQFGRSYYFKCFDCDGNTPIKNACRACGGLTKTRKRGLEFTAVCTDCDHTNVFFVNPKR